MEEIQIETVNHKNPIRLERKTLLLLATIFTVPYKAWFIIQESPVLSSMVNSSTRFRSSMFARKGKDNPCGAFDLYDISSRTDHN